MRNFGRLFLVIFTALTGTAHAATIGAQAGYFAETGSPPMMSQDVVSNSQPGRAVTSTYSPTWGLSHSRGQAGSDWVKAATDLAVYADLSPRNYVNPFAFSSVSTRVNVTQTASLTLNAYFAAATQVIDAVTSAERVAAVNPAGSEYGSLQPGYADTAFAIGAAAHFYFGLVDTYSGYVQSFGINLRTTRQIDVYNIGGTNTVIAYGFTPGGTITSIQSTVARGIDGLNRTESWQYFDTDHFTMSSNIALTASVVAGHSYYLQMGIGCQSYAINAQGGLAGINAICDGGQSGYWNGVTDISVPNFTLIDGDGKDYVFSSNLSPQPLVGGVPEPANWAMMLVGFGTLGGALRRKGFRGPIAA